MPHSLRVRIKRLAYKSIIRQSDCDRIIKALDNEPKTGHWIAVVDKWGDVVTTINGYKCSECGEFNGYKDIYCPNCGAKMVEPQESEDKE